MSYVRGGQLPEPNPIENPMLRPYSLRSCLGITLLFACLGLIAPVSIQARTWTTADGKPVEAELVEVGQDGKSVILDVKGKRYEVSLDRLSVRDQAYVEGMKDAMRRPTDAEIAKDIADDMAKESSDEPEEEDNEPHTIRLKARRVWRSREGGAVEAQFVRIRGSLVYLRLSGFSYDTIDFYNLSTADRQFLHDAHAQMGKANLVPPVRPDLVDANQQNMGTPSYQEHPPTPSTTNPMPETSTSNDSASGGGVSLPPNGFGAVEEPKSEVSLPSNGFGSIEEPTTESTPFDSEVKLPDSGFGSLPTGSSGATEVHDSFTPVTGDRPKKVGLPNSTIVDNSYVPETGDDRPLFDVASVPTSSNGFGGTPVQDVASSAPTPNKSTPKTTTPKSTTSGSNPFGTSAQPGGTRSPQPSGGSSERPQFGNSQTFTPSSEFTPMEPPAPREFTTADWNLQVFAVVLLSGGCLMMAGGYMWLIALAFLESLEWGLRSLIPGMAVMFGISEWEKASVPLLTMLLGVCLTLGGFGLLLGIS